MDLGIEGRVALVTGASKGIGLAIARALAAEGAKVALASRSPERIRAAAEEVGGGGFACDPEDLDAVPGLLADVERELGAVGIYAANTGGPPKNADPLGGTLEE